MAEPQNKDNKKIRSHNLFPVVGVGASAGGLEAFKRLVKAIPEDSGMAYILVQHLEPTHESMLTDLLQKVTHIPIHEITNNVRVEPNRIYIIPSNKILTATDGVLQLSPRPPRNEKNMPIDVFFTSLAEVHQSHAIGVILSGTATDGTLGLKAIKDHGGITFAQEQQSAGFDGMPQSAIDAEVVDFILTPEEIPLQLASLNQTYKTGLSNDTEDLPLKKEDAFRQLLSLLRVRRGADFTYYKQTTIRRRILRRMGLNKIGNIADYLAHVKENIPEQDILYQDLLIPVTEFFRDPKIYDTLCETLFPLLLKHKEEGNPLRIWIAGCSTGEEPYSIAMCLHEYLGDKAADIKIQLFATDLSEKAITKARSGTYTKKEVATLTNHRLQRYFTKVNGNFHINKFIRDMCVFACHNFLKDPPFAKMDLISCRNVLIYMEPFLQKKALTTFHYALKDNGYLLLGKSETTGPAADLFTVFGKNERLYTRKAVPARRLQVAADRNEKVVKEEGLSVGKGPGRDDFQKSADAVLSRYTPPGVVVNEQLDIVQFRGSIGTWLEPPPGKPSLNVLKMAREGLSFELRNALHKAKATNKPLVKENISIQFMGQHQMVTIEVIPLPNTVEPYFLILFKDAPSSSGAMGGAAKNNQPGPPDLLQDPENVHVRRLENELAQLREDMRGITEDQEAVNEELQSANEELLSGSEELQSLNEELETSKEEIQSTNEELTTLNHELFDRNEQLNLSRIYAESIVATIREPLIILDKEMQVKTANKAYYDKFKTVEEATEGKLFFEIGDKQWNLPALRSMLKNVLSEGNNITGFEIKQTFNALGERILLLNARQIFRKDNIEQLILLAIEDVTEAKKSEADQKLFTLELEKQVEERTASLKDANTSLRHSNDNLKQFATIASHDLQEPLRKIRTFANLLNLRHNIDIAGEAKELLGKISLSAERMSDLITDVLNFSKISDAGLVFEKTDLNSVLQQVIADFDLLITQKQASVNQEPLPVIDAVPLQIYQLFYNLLGNSLKFSKMNVPPQISIHSGMLPVKGMDKFPTLNSKTSYCEIIFRDNGIGFDQRFSEQMFLIFQRLNAREDFEGTGIGLALCRRAVINHHGEIYAESKMGEGAQFHIILPLKQ
ncbi:MAG TPA: chemotaxis protein CheB [Puia sp.]|nr:chemotaxis protein CheB [Puia sp.]